MKFGIFFQKFGIQEFGVVGQVLQCGGEYMITSNHIFEKFQILKHKVLIETFEIVSIESFLVFQIFENSIIFYCRSFIDEVKSKKFS